MNDCKTDYEQEFRNWFETQVVNNNKDGALVSAVYKPLFSAFMAGAEVANRRALEAIDNMSS